MLSLVQSEQSKHLILKAFKLKYKDLGNTMCLEVIKEMKKFRTCRKNYRPGKNF